MDCLSALSNATNEHDPLITSGIIYFVCCSPHRARYAADQQEPSHVTHSIVKQHSLKIPRRRGDANYSRETACCKCAHNEKTNGALTERAVITSAPRFR